MSSQLVCPICDSIRFSQSLDTGNLICDECGVESQQFREEAQDIAMPGLRIRFTSQLNQGKGDAFQGDIGAVASQGGADSESQSKLPDKQKKEDEEIFHNVRLVALEAFVCVLNAQVRFLIDKKNCNPIIRDIAWNLFTHWAKLYYRLVPDTVASNNLMWQASLLPTLGICALSCAYCQEAVLPKDIARWASVGKLPYLNATRECLTKELSELNFIHKLKPIRLVKAVHVQIQMSKLVAHEEYIWPPMREYFVSQKFSADPFVYVPCGNPPLIIIRFLQEMHLPEKILENVITTRNLRLILYRKHASINFKAKVSPSCVDSDFEIMTDILYTVLYMWGTFWPGITEEQKIARRKEWESIIQEIRTPEDVHCVDGELKFPFNVLGYGDLMTLAGDDLDSYRKLCEEVYFRDEMKKNPFIEFDKVFKKLAGINPVNGTHDESEALDKVPVHDIGYDATVCDASSRNGICAREEIYSDDSAHWLKDYSLLFEKALQVLDIDRPRSRTLQLLHLSNYVQLFLRASHDAVEEILEQNKKDQKEKTVSR